MNHITLRTNDENLITEVTQNAPLANSQIDDNFQFLNATKLSADGSIEVEKLEFGNNVVIRKRGSNDNLLIDGDLEITGSITLPEGFEIDSQVAEDVFEIATGGEDNNRMTLLSLVQNNVGFTFGGSGGDDEVPLAIMLDGEFSGGTVNDFWWKFVTQENVGVEIRARDFVLTNDPSLSLISLNATLENLMNNPFDGFDDGTIINEEDTLVDAIKALDEEDIPSIKQYVGQDELANHGYNIIRNNANLTDAVEDLDSIVPFIIHKVSNITNTGSAASVGTFTTITVDGINLPSEDGLVVLKYLGEATLIISPNGTDTIEDQNAIAVDIKNLVVTLIKKGTGVQRGTNWRII